MDPNRRANLICEIAERHAMTTLEVVRMVRLAAFGPLAVRMYDECGIYEPGEDERIDALRVQNRLKERPPIEELMEIWTQCHEMEVWRCEHEPDLAKRASMFTKLREAEKAMEAHVSERSECSQRSALMERNKSDASLIWPGLPSATRQPVEQKHKSMWPSLEPKPKPPPNRRRDATLRHLDQVIAKLGGKK